MGVNREIAIVTGAARGIGKATSLRFEKEGITVIETDILPDSGNKVVPENPQLESKDKPMIHDVSDEASWSELVESVFKKYGRIDILVNNAGIGTLPDFEEEDESGWNEMLSVNAKSIWPNGFCIDREHLIPTAFIFLFKIRKCPDSGVVD